MDRVDYQLHLFTGSDYHTPKQRQFVITTEITQVHIATESVKLSAAVVDFWCENLRRFAENQPLLGVVDRRAGY